ncbi:MAG: CPBP family intramembrane metalloprotease [Bryobacteraceae bacterium]|nr:CPBP family intramembrane metalloprotease [Bryobacteraceae bacterium]
MIADATAVALPVPERSSNKVLASRSLRDLLLVFVLTIPLGIVAAILGAGDRDRMSSGLALAIGAGTLLIMCAVAIRRIQRTPEFARSLRESLVVPPKAFLPVSLACGAALSAAGWAYEQAARALLGDGAVRYVEVEQMLRSGGWVLAVAISQIALLAPAAEELLFRGCMFGAFLREGSIRFGVPFTAALFAVSHIPMFALMPYYFGVGIALAWLYRRNGTLLAPFAAHALNNALASVHFLLTGG